MKSIKVVLLVGAFLGGGAFASAKKLVLSDLQFFKELGVPLLQKHPRLNMAVADVSGISAERLQKAAHSLNRCGGYEALADSVKASHFDLVKELKTLEEKIQKDRKPLSAQSVRMLEIKKDPQVEALASQVSVENLRTWVTWMQDFGTRYARASDPNPPVVALEKKIREVLASSKIPFQIELISHQSTSMKTVKLTFPGQSEPAKKIILGAHYDSIAGWFGGNNAPGADDDASGSANLLEVARILSQYQQPRRTMEFFWYAGEEEGLLGSAEIARDYKERSENVLSVLQLDMTLFPGDGPFTIGLVDDFTTPWLRELLENVNKTYFNFQMRHFECGYGCSDHASWYRQGFSTVIPFEAEMDTMNRDIHTSRDRIQPSYNFEHSAAFSKLALAYALEVDGLENSFTK